MPQGVEPWNVPVSARFVAEDGFHFTTVFRVSEALDAIRVLQPKEYATIIEHEGRPCEGTDLILYLLEAWGDTQAALFLQHLDCASSLLSKDRDALGFTVTLDPKHLRTYALSVAEQQDADDQDDQDEEDA